MPAKLAHAVEVRDKLLKTLMLEAVQSYLPSAGDKAGFVTELDNIFDKASQDWEQSLAAEIGENKAQTVLHIMQRAI